MKKFLLFICLMIILNMMFAQEATVTIGTVTAPPEGQVIVPVTLTEISHPSGISKISGFVIYISYDPGVLTGITDNVPTIAVDPFWSTQGTLITNTIVDEPEAGLNTIAIIWATGGIVTPTLPQKIAEFTFNYTSGTAELLWAAARLKGEDADVETKSYMVDYDGINYLLTTIPGTVKSGLKE
jgi:hypothetical protein